MDLQNKHCAPCNAGARPVARERIRAYLPSVPGWKVKKRKQISKEFKFKDFRGSIGFVKKVAHVAEREYHHPDISIFYNKVRLELWTHSIGGLSENDFILAAKINKLVE